MSRSPIFHFLQKYLFNRNNNVRKLVKYTGIGVGCASVLPAVVSNCPDGSANIIANVNGGIRFIR